MNSSTGALNFVPLGFSGANHLKIAIYTTGNFYDVSYVPNGAIYTLTSATLETTLTGAGPEGFVYVPVGSPEFTGQTMLVAESSTGSIAAYSVNGNGDPIVGSRQAFVTGLTGAEGSVIDPVTGDLLFSSFGSGNHAYEVQGFVRPAVITVPALSKWAEILLGLLIACAGAVGLRQSSGRAGVVGRR